MNKILLNLKYIKKRKKVVKMLIEEEKHLEEHPEKKLKSEEAKRAEAALDRLDQIK